MPTEFQIADLQTKQPLTSLRFEALKSKLGVVGVSIIAANGERLEIDVECKSA